MGTKNNPGDFDCYANAEPDEPMFILLARDPVAPFLVREWIMARKAADKEDTPEKIAEAIKLAAEMEIWRMDNR